MTDPDRPKSEPEGEEPEEIRQPQADGPEAFLDADTFGDEAAEAVSEDEPLPPDLPPSDPSEAEDTASGQEHDPAAETPRARPADAVASAIMGLLPADMGPYLSLSRVDRPVGFWLLALPCFIGLAFARLQTGWSWHDLFWLPLLGLGAIAMRGAGCTWNDIQDRKIDAEVERTRGRPLPSGQVSLGQAWIWLGIQLVVGFLVWACLPGDARIVALLAIPLVAAYPFMKRMTWWPQAWLGLTFSWGALVAAAIAGNVTLLSVILFLGLALWTVAYDTIYAIQDREDDALIGVKSTARLFGARTGLAIFAFHLGAAVLVALASALAGAPRIGALTALVFLGHGAWQVMRLKRAREANALEVFRSNVTAGGILFVGLALAAFAAIFRAESPFRDAPDSQPVAERAGESRAPRVYDPLDQLRGTRPVSERPWWMPIPPANPPADPFTAPATGEEETVTPPLNTPEPAPAEQDASAPRSGLFSDFFGNDDGGDGQAPDPEPDPEPGP